jgi:hypothetical protein
MIERLQMWLIMKLIGKNPVLANWTIATSSTLLCDTAYRCIVTGNHITGAGEGHQGILTIRGLTDA